MAEWEGVHAESAGKGLSNNPVIKFAKKRPAVAAGIVGGAVLLVYLFKPASQPAATYTDPSLEGAGGYYPEGTDSGASGGGGGSVDTAGLMDTLAGMIDAQGQSQADQWDTFGAQYDQDLGGILDYIDQAIDSIEIPEGALAPVEMVTPPTLAPVAAVAPATGSAGIMAQMEANASEWRAIFDRTGLMDTPEQQALHNINLSLADQIGGIFNSQTGTYKLGGTSPAPAPAAPSGSLIFGTARQTTTTSKLAPTIAQQMDANSQAARAIFDRTKSWADPEIARLHEANVALSSGSGASFNAGSGIWA